MAIRQQPVQHFAGIVVNHFHYHLDKIVCLAMSALGGAHAAFSLMITCVVRRYGFLLRTLPPSICRMYFAIAE
jgi:hypothetical protein